MKKFGRALGPKGIPIEVGKYLGEMVVFGLTKFFNKIIMTKEMLIQKNAYTKEWRKSILVPIQKKRTYPNFHRL